MSIPRRKTPMSALIRELHMHNAHQDALVSGRAILTDEEDERAPEHFECRGCGDEMSPNDFLTFSELCGSCWRERDEENEADAKRDDYE